MNSFKTLLVALMAVALGAGWQAASGQTQFGGPFKPGDPESDVYTVDYFANANTATAPDATVRVINPGTTSASATEAEDLCALIFVFDANQELSECCGCFVSANAELTLSVNNNLTASPLLGVKLHTGVIKIVSTTLPVGGGVCDPRGTDAGVLEFIVPTLRAWATHIQNKVGTTYPVTEGESQAAVFSNGENVDLAEDCAVLRELGSGSQGVCNCPPGH